MKKLTLLSLFIMSQIISYAQINYVDISPDTIIQNNMIYMLDLDGDGIDELKFVHEDSVSGLNGNGIGVTLMHYNVEFLGNLPPQDPGHFYPYKVNDNVLIDSTANGETWVVKHPGIDVIRVMNLQFSNGSYAGQWIGGVTDKYLGIRFKISNLWHYGWIRMDVAANATKLIIKDYAYNSKPDQKIFTGQRLPFGPDILAVKYSCNDCGNVLGFIRNDSINLSYNKIYLQNTLGTYDSIGYVSSNLPSYFVDADTMVVKQSRNYKVSNVDTNGIESLMSDSVVCPHISLSKSTSNNPLLLWSRFYNKNHVGPTFIYYNEKYCHSFPFDSINPNAYNNIIPYSDLLHTWNTNYFSYKVGIVLQNPFKIPGYGMFDTLKTAPIYSFGNYLLNPIAQFSLDSSYSSTFLTTYFSDNSWAGITSWKWYFGDGSTSSLQNPTHIYSASGNYDVALKISNCYGEDSIMKHNFIQFTSNIFTPSKEYHINIYPNPVHDLLTVSLNNDETIKSISIISLAGKMIVNISGNYSNKWNIDVSDLAPGLYLLELITKDDIRYVNKIIIEP